MRHVGMAAILNENWANCAPEDARRAANLTRSAIDRSIHRVSVRAIREQLSGVMRLALITRNFAIPISIRTVSNQLLLTISAAFAATEFTITICIGTRINGGL